MCVYVCVQIVPVERIVKARYQDSLEFLQWVYEYFNRNFNGRDYDPIKRRSRSKGVKGLASKKMASRAPEVKSGKENERVSSGPFE